MIKFAAALLFGISGTGLAAASVSQGRAAYDLNRINEAATVYRSVIADSGQTSDERARANIELARVSWLIDGDADQALARTRAARALDTKACESGQMEARILREASRFGELFGEAGRLTRACSDRRKRDPITLELIKAHLDDAAMMAKLRARELVAASSLLTSLAPEARSSLDAATATLEIGLLTKNSATALAGWRAYYWLLDDAGPPALKSFAPAATFVRGLSRAASQKQKIDLLYLLVRAGFAQQAERFMAAAAIKPDPTNPKLKMVDAYLGQRKALIATVIQVNRALAHGGSKDDPRLQKAAFQSLGALMAAAGASGDPRKAVLDHYGLIGSVGQTSGYPSLHIGHVVEDRTENIRQYGHEAKVRFAAIDNLWANGFESWLWDGSAETGGWSGDDIIIHVRPAYTSGPASALALVGNTQSRRELESRLPALNAADLALARSGTLGTFEGLNTRLRLQLVDQLAAHVRKSTSASGFRRAFLAEFWRANLQQSIFVHEGRHAIDKALAVDPSKLDDMTLEYQANLSELALSDYPRMALYNLNRGIGGSSPHERASTRLMSELARWTRDHSGEVRGFDPRLPAEVQLDKLTDGQIRDIARSLDPLARSAATTSAGSRF